uniref:Uncharacterized protein n=1 Tax=Arundo donax TaxID=35708 RepID=A0A0A9A2Y1_ARUDO
MPLSIDGTRRRAHQEAGEQPRHGQVGASRCRQLDSPAIHPKLTARPASAEEVGRCLAVDLG